MGWQVWPGCTSSSPAVPATRPRWWSGSRPTGGCWSGRWSRPATRWWRSTRWRPAAIGSATPSPGPSPTAGDARMLADLVRTDRHHHRPTKGDSGLAEAVKVLARGHQQLVWVRQRQANMLRSALRAFYPAALAAFSGDPGGRDAVAVLRLAPTPELGRALSHAELVDALRRAGRRRQVEARAAAIQAMLAGQQLEASPVVAAVAVIASLSQQLAGLEAALTAAFTAHPDAVIVQSQPGLGVVLAARVLAEFGDDPQRYVSAKAGKAYAGTAPITRASGLRQVVLARSVGNRRLSTACHLG